jgi:hypothetical protein
LFELLYDKDKAMSDQYRARAFLDTKPPQNILDIISGPAIDDGRAFSPMDQASLRMRLERACLLEGKDAPPWDELFPVKAAGEEVERSVPEDAEPVAEDSGTEFPPREQSSARAPEVGRGMQEDKGPVPDLRDPADVIKGMKEEDLYVCPTEDGGCGKGSPTASACIWCGATFDEEGRITLPEKKAEAPKGRQRNAAKKTASAPTEEPAATKPKFRAGF